MTKTTNLLARAAMTLLFAVLSSAGAWAADVVTIGTANTPHTAPIMGDANYALSQEVYTAAEINHAAGMIGAIAFNTETGGLTRKLDIYVTRTDETSPWHFEPVTADDLYFSGEVYFQSGQWTTIDFDKAYNYDGVSNLLITIDDNTNASYGWGSLKNYIFYSGGCYFAYDDNLNFDPLNPLTDGIAISPSSVSWKNQIQIIFEDLLRPSKLNITNIGDKSAQIECNLRGDATAWNMRYREAVAIGIPELEWVTVNNLTTRSQIIDGLTPSTQYEVQVQGVFAEGQSDWTDSRTFYTSCCPADQMSEILFSGRGFTGCQSAFQIVDAETGVEMAYVSMNSGDPINGKLLLGCDRLYKVNWISCPQWPQSDYSCFFQLSFLPNDAFYTMNYGDAPEAPTGEEGKSFELTKFKMDCTKYDYAMPTGLTAYAENYQGATLEWKSEDAKQWQLSVSTDPMTGFEDGKIILVDSNPYVLTGLEAEKEHYVSVRAVEMSSGGVVKEGRPCSAITFTTTSKNETPDPVEVTIQSSQKAKIDVKMPSGTETKYNLIYSKMSNKRTPVDFNQVVVLDLDGDDNPSYDDIQKLPEEKRIYSYGSKNKKFDHVIFIPLRSLEQVMLKMIQMKTGALPEPYSVGWLSKKDLGDDLLKIPFSTLKAKLKKKYRISSSKLKKLKRIYDEKGFIPKNILKRLKKKHTRADEENEEGYLWIRHDESAGGEMDIWNIEVISAEDAEQWYEIPLNEGEMEYTLSDLTPSTTYMVLVEPVYSDGSSGEQSAVTAFTTVSEMEDPSTGEFTVGNGKKVNFAKVNLRYNAMTESWSFAAQAYDIIGEENAHTNASGKLYPADYRDLFCWSTYDDDYGTYYAYNYADEEMAAPYFQGDFVEWGEIPALIGTLGEGWRTLNKDEWDYLLTERNNAATLTAHATVADMKGLIIAPDNWMERVLVNSQLSPLGSERYTAEQWAIMEAEGAVFLPASGQFIKGRELENIGEAGFYWTSTASNADMIGSENEAYVATFTDTDAKTTIISRRAGSAVRLVKDSGGTTAIRQVIIQQSDDNNWYDLSGRRLSAKPAQRGVYIHQGKKIVIR